METKDNTLWHRVCRYNGNCFGATIWHPFVKYPLKQFSIVTTIIRQLKGKIQKKKK